jgi:hypothetical protein
VEVQWQPHSRDKRGFIIEEIKRKSAAIFPEPTPPLTSKGAKENIKGALCHAHSGISEIQMTSMMGLGGFDSLEPGSRVD